MLLTGKQRDYVRSADSRWNFKGGATRSGKTWLDTRYVIPARIRARAGKEGLVRVIGVTEATIERNVLSPMRERFGSDLVGRIGDGGQVRLFGEMCTALGAGSAGQAAKLRGSSVKYCYGDEVAEWSMEVFDLLKSRLDRPYSVFDGTYNPKGPGHWLKAFLDSGADIFHQTYALDDNPFLDGKVREDLKREYAGTVLYDRYIRGLWTAAEGRIYVPFCDDPARFIRKEAPLIREAFVGVDFGGGKSAHAFCCVGITPSGAAAVLDEYRCQDALRPERLSEDFCDFLVRCRMDYPVGDVWCDSAEQTLINGLRAACARRGLAVNIGNAMKRPINDRIRAVCLLMGAGRFFVLEKCRDTIQALRDALWDGKSPVKDVRLDDGSTNIDSLDAMEYALEREIPTLIDCWRWS